jgi:hypothetical protein
MAETAAVRAAISLLHLPSSIRRYRSEPLPAGVDVLLQILAGDSAVLAEVAAQTERPPAMVRDAAKFFVEQIMLVPDTGSYRVLGAVSSAPAADLRHNMALLLRWLHPDKMQSDDRRALVDRVTLAWETLKTPERRAAYDAERTATAAKLKPRKRSRSGQPRKRAQSGGVVSYLRRTLYLLFGR